VEVSAVSAVERHYTTSEVSALLSLHEETVRKYARLGELESVRIGNDRRYPESAIAKFLRVRTGALGRLA
jgi:excisionase family DNA binding protein